MVTQIQGDIFIRTGEAHYLSISLFWWADEVLAHIFPNACMIL